jgi:hypothetical protein
MQNTQNSQTRSQTLTEEQSTPAVPSNSFPIDVFPKVIREFMDASSIKMGMQTDYLGLTILTAAGTAIGNTHKVFELIEVAPIIYGLSW